MALRLRRDVQKASYYVWFLGADEAKGLRGPRVINSVLPYLIDRSREQEPLKVTLQVSHKGIKILQGSSKHFIPHSAITSSVQSEDIVACVLLLYNPATKCPLHVHAYRCDSETTAEALHQQLQILINRPENQKRFEELESRLGIVPVSNGNGSHKSSLPFDQQQQQKHAQRRHEASPKRFSSSLGSDTGNSTRESECSEDRNNSPMSRSPPIIKQKGDLFDSLAAELRAKLNGNGPPLLLPPRDYDTVHRSKGNLAAIELRRCRNSLIVGASTTPAAAVKQQMSSRGSSGIGSDLAPSPERQDINSSSEDEHWSNEADNSVIALKPSQIQMERKQPLNRKSAVQPPEDNYLRDLPSKPYNPSMAGGNSNNISASIGNRSEKELRPIAVRPSQSWNKEDEIKPIIMRPSDYDAKFNRVLMDKHHDDAAYKERISHNNYNPPPEDTGFCKYKEDHQQPAQKLSSSSYDAHDGGFHNHIDKMLKKKLSLERKPSYKVEEEEADYDSDADHQHIPVQQPVTAAVSVPMGYRKENLTDKQKFQEYNGKKVKSYNPEPDRFGRHRYVDPADLPFTQPKSSAVPHQYPSHSPEPREVVQQRPVERHRERQRPTESNRPREREFFSHSNERNPYREPGSIPYIESMEKMMKSQAMRYKQFENDPKIEYQQEMDKHLRISPRKSLPRSEKSSQHVADDHDVEKEFCYSRKSQSRDPREYVNPNVTPKDRFKDAKEKFRAMERSRYIAEKKEVNAQPSMTSSSRNLQRRSSIEHADSGIRYDDWSDEEELPVVHPRSSSREQWEQSRDPSDLPREYHEMRGRDIPDSHNDPRDYHHHRDVRDHREPQQYRERPIDKRNDGYGPGAPQPISNSKSLSNLTKGYRHSYAEPAFARSGGRVGLAAVNPY
ncbi:ankyrin repeat domain-containing protein 11 [Episyrphus balteatus]|uniref:ankyrin repeat domain-containing protein 11 n=1 Tax=Episyrphus balteatus TaxID=286459 RepID=UPI00248533B8|nr:ankyrin repeat domain-containing protein 11 [Episyrphus balteatus]XP_055844881.1 ankyrin repeat domain-containing protein 11 [Episyrphus balteatus]